MLFEDKLNSFKKSDIAVFKNFIKENFQKKYILGDEKFLEWQYGEIPALTENFKEQNQFSIILLKDGSKVLGFLGVMPFDFKILAQVKRINFYANLFVDPKVRSLGLGVLLMQKGVEGVDTANITAYKPSISPTYKKFGDWREMGNFSRYVMIFNSRPVNGLAENQGLQVKSSPCQISAITSPPKLSKSSNGLTHNYTYIKHFGSDFDAFWKTVNEKYKITIERSSKYLNWRYARHPYFEYSILKAEKQGKLSGFLIYRFEAPKDFKIARIIDFVSADEAEIGLLNKFILDVQATGADMADFMFSGNYCHQSLKSVGFFETSKTAFDGFPIYFNPVSTSKTFINFMVFTQDESINKDEFHNPAAWYLIKGDSDQDRPNPH